MPYTMAYITEKVEKPASPCINCDSAYTKSKWGLCKKCAREMIQVDCETCDSKIEMSRQWFISLRKALCKTCKAPHIPGHLMESDPGHELRRKRANEYYRAQREWNQQIENIPNNKEKKTMTIIHTGRAMLVEEKGRTNDDWLEAISYLANKLWDEIGTEANAVKLPPEFPDSLRQAIRDEGVTVLKGYQQPSHVWVGFCEQRTMDIEPIALITAGADDEPAPAIMSLFGIPIDGEIDDDPTQPIDTAKVREITLQSGSPEGIGLLEKVAATL